ncbi:MAG: cytochrome P450 [Truepera sp.]|nr:cytochrome P450 [Truepera sp.]
MAAPFEPTAADFLQDPYPTYARLRLESPIFHYDPWDKWVFTRYQDIDALLRDRHLGRVIHHLQEPHERPPADPGLAPFDAIQQGSLLELEPPDHPRIRGVVHEAFTPRHVRALSGKVEALCRELVDSLEDLPGREADLLTSFAVPLPVTVIADLLGVPEGERGALLPWSKAIIGMFEPERTPEMERGAVEAAGDFAAYIRALIARKRLQPADDLISRMVAAHDADPGRISEGEIVANSILFLNAGHEAVVNVIGNGMKALLSHPEQLARLREDPTLISGAVEEMMRFDTPLQFFERFVLEDFEFGGRTFAKGEKFCLYYASANRDPEVFEDPDRFDIGRTPNPHIAFGLGLHFCIGAPLARVELAAAVRELLTRLPRLELAQDRFSYHPKNVFRYLTELRVAY